MTRSRLATIAGPVLDVLLFPFVVPASLLLWIVRRVGLHRLRLCRSVLLRVGILPVRKHYYEPFVDPRRLRPASEERYLPGIDWNIEQQLGLLAGMQHADELDYLLAPRHSRLDFRLGNGAFESGDAEFLYQLIRKTKPRRIIEIGSGHSTLIACDATKRNLEESPDAICQHTCIEPFEAKWLEGADVTILRRRLEEVDSGIFRELEAGDLLFIDSSHVIRPQGDVLVEYLEILPTLQNGVIVHVHDIFSPRDYPDEWRRDRIWLWNEQYLLEAFLSDNRAWKVLAALNLLKHRHFDALRRVCPYVRPDREPGSFYIQKVGEAYGAA